MEEEASGTESEGSSSDKRMKHSSHHADGDELSEDVENMGIEVHDAYPEESGTGPTSVVSSNEVDTSLKLDSRLEENIGFDSPLSLLYSHALSSNEEEDDHNALVSYHIPVPKLTKPELPDNMTPITIMLCKTIGLMLSARLLRILMDSGTTKTMIHRRVLPSDIQPKKLSQAKPVSTLAGTMTITDTVTLRQIKLPEFDKNRTIDECCKQHHNLLPDYSSFFEGKMIDQQCRG